MSEADSRLTPVRFVFTAAVAATTFLLAAPAVAQTFMTEDELLATIPGSTIDSKTDEGVKWAQAYSKFDGKKKKGAIAGNFDGTDFKSKWYVENGQWCENWGDGQACFQAERVSAKKLRIYANGKPRPNLWVLR